MTELRTARLLLRPWRDADYPPFAALNADAEVMRHFPQVLPGRRSDELADRLRAHVDEQGWGLWATEVIGGAAFIGFVGLQPVPFDAPFTPAVEVGWRLARAHWGRGYAPEAARAAAGFAFAELGLSELVSMTVPANLASQRVMQKLGMTHDPADDFDHPRLPHWEHRHHVLYRLSRRRWATLAS